VTHLYFIRHAQQFSAHNEGGPVLADHEDGLTEKGHAQARRVAARVARHIQPDVLYSSPLLRARQTARHISAATGLPLNIDPNLAELRLNCPQEATANIDFDGWVRARRLPYTPPFPGGESLADLLRRGALAFDTIAQTYRGKTIVIVTHGGLIEMVNFHLLGIPIERNLISFMRCDHTAIFHWHWLELKDIHVQGWELLAANDTHHLDGI
jgi:broad specificity phosphatase PhoE